jgi:crossover junction endodeoxyribonuclease RuvC
MIIRVLGVDPALRHTGYCVLQVENAKRFSVLRSGRIITEPGSTLAAQLKDIYTSMKEIVSQAKADVAMIEETYVNLNARTSLGLAHGRAAAICAIVSCGSLLPLAITPSQVKKTLTGKGNADKREVADAVTRLLPALRGASHDVTDAAAIAICGGLQHALSVNLVGKDVHARTTTYEMIKGRARAVR